MLKKIYQELVLIRKELQAIRSSKEFQTISEKDAVKKSRELLGFRK